MTNTRFSAARLLAILALLGAGAALAQRPADRLVAARPGPLYGTADGGEGELLAFDARLAPALVSLAAGESLAVDAWPVAPGILRTMVLTRTEIYAPDARIVAIGKDGEIEVPRSTWAFFLGRDPNGTARVAVGLDPETGSMRGLVSSDRGLHELLPPAAWTGGRHRLAAPETRDADGTPRTWRCSEEELPLTASGPVTDAPVGREALAGRTALAFSKYAVVAIDTDNEFMGLKFIDNTTNATNYIANLFIKMNVIYERDVSLHLLQGYTILRLSTAADPYVQNTGANASGAELSEFSNYWNTHYGAVKRTVAAILSGKQPTTNSASGVAWVSGLCSKSTGYSFNKIERNVGDTSTFDNLITAHEIGHNFGSPHTHCYAAPLPDTCFSGEAGCYAGATSCPGVLVINGHTTNGTLMSYCHLISCGNDTLAFHPRTLNDYFNARINTASTGPSQCIFNGTAAPAGPTVSSIVPPTGVQAGGTPVVINGSGFVTGATVAFIDLTGSVSLTSVIFVNSGRLTAVAPAHAAGAMDVVVFNPDNQTGTLRNGFTYTSVGGTTPPPPVSAATRFNTLTPCRAIDTRSAVAPSGLGVPPITPLGLRPFAVSGVCGVPAGTVAISANVTVVTPAATGDLVLYPNGIAVPPNASSLSFRAGLTRANNTIVYLASDGSFLLKNNAAGGFDFLLDVNGYFK